MSSQQQYIKNLTSENFKDLQKYYSNDSVSEVEENRFYCVFTMKFFEKITDKR